MHRPTETEFPRWLRRRTPPPDTPDLKGRDVAIFGRLLGLVVTPLLGLIALVSIPLTPFMRAAHRWRAESFARQMRETGRVAEWDYAQSQRLAGKDTFIFANTAPKRAWRLWSMRVLQLSALCVSVATLVPSSVCVAQQEEKPDWCKALPRPEYKSLQRVLPDEQWFEVYKVAPATFAIYEPHQFEETISYLIVGTKQALLFDTGMGIGNLKGVVSRLTSRPIVVLNSHTHNDHVGDNWQFPYVFGMDTAFTRQNAKGSRTDAQAELAEGEVCGDLPKGFDPSKYVTRPWKIELVVHDGFKVNLGHRTVEIIATPGHTPDAISLIDRENGLLFTGDTYYPAPIWLYRPETDLAAYLASVKKLVALASQVKMVLGAHNIPVADPAVLPKLQDAIEQVLDGKVKPKAVNGTEATYEVGEFSFRMHYPLPAVNSLAGSH